MILILTNLDVSDNSGVKSVKSFKIYKNFFASIGSLVYVSIKEIKTNVLCKYKKGTILKGIVVRTRNNINRSNGNFLSFDSNSIVLIDTKHDLIATRIFGPLPIELRRKGLLKLLSVGSIII